MHATRGSKRDHPPSGQSKGSRPDKALETGLDHLFALPLNQFTPARNALVTKLKKAGQAEDAERIRGLSRPPVSAWVVNQLYWRHRKAFDALLTTGERFSAAQAAQLAGTAVDIRGPLDARRQALSALTRLAAAVLNDSGHSLTPDTMRRITTTLEALGTYGRHPDAPPPGRLTSDVDPPGFEALAALVPRVDREPAPGDEPHRVLPFRQQQSASRRRTKLTPEEEQAQHEAERQAQHEAAVAARVEAERALKAAKEAATRARAALKAAAARSKEVENARVEAEGRFEKASAAADAARLEARRVASEAEDAAQAVQDAEQALAKAKRAIQ